MLKKRLDKYHTRLIILEDDFDEAVDKNTVIDIINNMNHAMHSCKCQNAKRPRLEKSG
jgi:hypothetical protein